MKIVKFVLAAAIAASAIGALSVATSTSAEAWYCRAKGTTGAWGWGRSGSLGEAKGIALAECAVRTPRYGRCYITSCK
ncbi:MAG: hypothetical protein ACLPN5_17555 [Roseiarcus sp.]